MVINKTLVVILLLASLVSSFEKLVLSEGNVEIQQDELYISQKLDHFSPDSRVFQ